MKIKRPYKSIGPKDGNTFSLRLQAGELFGRFYLFLSEILFQFGEAHAFRFASDFRPPLPHKFNGVKLLLLLLHCFLSIHNK